MSSQGPTSASADEREGIICSPRKQQTAAFLRVEMSSHKLIQPASALKAQNGTLYSCLLPSARPGQASDVHLFCCRDNKVVYGYVHIRLKLNDKIQEETTTWKRTLSIHPCTGTARDVNRHGYNPTGLGVSTVTQLSCSDSSTLPKDLSHNRLSRLFSNTTAHHTTLPSPLCRFQHLPDLHRGHSSC